MSMEPASGDAIERARRAAEDALAGKSTPQLKAERNKVKQDLDALAEESPAKLTRALSHVLDDLVAIPGTKIRIGMDPVLSLVPWAGSATGAVFGGAILIDAIRLRAPLSVIARMGANSLLDWLLGMIPFVGAFLDAIYRSNRKNLKLLNRSIENRELVRDASVKYWVAVAAMLALLLSVVVAIPVLIILGLADLVTTG